MALKHIPLSLNERAMTGYTDLYIIKYTDLTEGTDNTGAVTSVTWHRTCTLRPPAL